MKSCVIYVVRHGQSEHNKKGLTSGHSNPQLTSEGKKQARATKKILENVKFDEVYSSDLDRAIDTAEIIFGSPVPINHRLSQLRERNFGIYESLPETEYGQVKRSHKSKIESLTDEEKWRYKFHEHTESNFELATRIIETLVDIAENNTGKTVLVAAHGGVIRTTLISLGYATEEELPSGSIENAGFAELLYEDGEFTVESANGANLVTQ